MDSPGSTEIGIRGGVFMVKKILATLGVLGLLAIFIVLNLRAKGQAPTVWVDVVKRGPIRSTVKAEGEIQAKNQVRIGSDVMGRILEIRVEEGDTVKRGDTLCLIDPSTYLAQVRQAKARLQQDLARLEKAKNDYLRAQELYADSLIPSSTLEEAKTAYATLQAQIRVDSSLLEEALSTYAKTVITSPIDGVVLGVHKEVGEMVVVGTINTPGSVIMDIADLNTLEVEASVDETEVVKIQPGQPVRIRVDAYPDTLFHGVVQRISGIPTTTVQAGGTSLQGVSYPILIRILGHPKLYPGMTANCEIITGEKDSTLVIPFTALGKRTLEGKSRDVVFRIHGDRVEMVPVSLGLTGIRVVEIVDGLSEGDTIAVGPHPVLAKLEDGQQVSLEWKKGIGQKPWRPQRKAGR